jgi:hypothetical protein
MHPQARKIISSLEQLPSNWQIVPTFGKRPLGGKQWQHKTYSPKQLQTELIRTQCKIWSGKRYTRVTGVAIVCGDNQPQGHIIAIDCDGLHAWGQILILTEKLEEDEIKEIAPQKLCDRALAHLPPTVAFTSGGKYKCQFLYLLAKYQIWSLEAKTTSQSFLLPTTQKGDITSGFPVAVLKKNKLRSHPNG